MTRSKALVGMPAADPPEAAVGAPVAGDTGSHRIIDSFVPAAAQRVRVYVWQVPVRITHWTIVLSVAVLSLTGAYIADPFLVPPGGSFMAGMRALHLLFAFVLVAAGLFRTYWLFAGNRFAHWRAFVPTNRAQLEEVVRQTAWYLFLRPQPPRVLGHNQLAAGTYLVVFVLLGLQTVTGFGLMGIHGMEPWATLFGWFVELVGVQWVRLIHHLLMWAILAFLVHHVYAAVLVDHWERNGLLSSIITGYKFATRAEVVEARDGGLEVEEHIE
ncbi:MAG TPA: Ni/Fe-hydrogenase, b-type cytochrome subunit [Candidatus Binatia bacterium]|nr:Ni/Fe-hydrogenase, b-type cytochrome subunit [Candidatus Binatia bacterium]